MKIMLYITLAALALAAPRERADVGKLRPVEVIAVNQSGEGYVIRTDLGDRGAGATLAEAVNDLRDTAPGIVYLDTAEYLLLENEVTDTAYLEQILKPRVRVCGAQTGIDLEGSGQYLDIHRPKERLRDGFSYNELEFLWVENGLFCLE